MAWARSPYHAEMAEQTGHRGARHTSWRERVSAIKIATQRTGHDTNGASEILRAPRVWPAKAGGQSLLARVHVLDAVTPGFWNEVPFARVRNCHPPFPATRRRGGATAVALNCTAGVYGPNPYRAGRCTLRPDRHRCSSTRVIVFEKNHARLHIRADCRCGTWASPTFSDSYGPGWPTIGWAPQDACGQHAVNHLAGSVAFMVAIEPILKANCCSTVRRSLSMRAVPPGHVGSASGRHGMRKGSARTVLSSAPTAGVEGRVVNRVDKSKVIGCITNPAVGIADSHCASPRHSSSAQLPTTLCAVFHQRRCSSEFAV